MYGLAHYYYFSGKSVFIFSIINIHFLPIYYLSGPMLFFYVRSTLKDNSQLSKIDFLHFIPFLIGLIYIIPYSFQSFESKIAFNTKLLADNELIKSGFIKSFFPNYINLVARPVFLLTYALGSGYLIFKYSRLKKRKYSPLIQRNNMIKWLKTIVMIAFVLSFFYIIITYKYLSTNQVVKQLIDEMEVSILAGICYCIIPISILIFPDVLYGIPRVPKGQNKYLDENIKQAILQSNDPLEATAKDILNFLDESKAYLNPKFGIQDLIKGLDIPKHHVYYCLNNIIQNKFTIIKSELRVNYAKELLLSSKAKELTMEGIGMESGFASKSNFFAIFKEFTGKTPLEFIEADQIDKQ
jgi:AraC-like DNA-binding protein